MGLLNLEYAIAIFHPSGIRKLQEMRRELIADAAVRLPLYINDGISDIPAYMSHPGQTRFNPDGAVEQRHRHPGQQSTERKAREFKIKLQISIQVDPAAGVCPFGDVRGWAIVGLIGDYRIPVYFSFAALHTARRPNLERVYPERAIG